MDVVRSVNLNLFVALEALLVEKSVTRAATRNGVSQPAMSHSLRLLRGLFDDPLLVRGGWLTPLAESLRSELRAGLGDLQRVLDARDDFAPETSTRTFRVAASDTFAVVSLHRFLADLALRAPGVDLVVRPPEKGTTEALASGAVDLVAGSAEQSPGGGISSHELYRERFVCLVRRDHPAIRTRLGIATYAKLSHVLVTPDEDPGYMDRMLAEVGRSRRVAVRLPDYAGVGHVIASTDMVATVPERLARRLAETLPLRVLAPPMRLPAFPICIYWHPRFDAEPGHAWLRERLASAVDAPPVSR